MRRTAVVFALICLLVPAVVAAVGPGAVRVGEHLDYAAQSPHPYPSLGGDEAMLVWAETLSFPGSTYVAPHFSRFELAAGDEVVVRSPDGQQRWVYTGLGRGELGLRGGFYSTRIKGDTAVVELWSRGDASAFGLSIDHVGRGYSNDELIALWNAGLGEKMNLVRPEGDFESICTADDKENAICYELSEPAIYDKSRAVARLFIGGGFLCTGWLVGNEGHMMTNEHCITSETDVDNTDYEWMAEGATCAENCPQLGCDGVIEATEGQFIQDNVGLDYALVIPDTSTGTSTDLPATYGFFQLRGSGAVQDERIYIPQHPGGRGKEIAVFSTYPTDTSGFANVNSLVEPVCDPSSSTPEVGYFADTEGGSSGSPVLGYSDNLVIALHHCRGSAFCTSGNPGTDDPNRGVPIGAIIDDLGGNLPPSALGLFADGFESGDTSGWDSTTSP